MGDIRHQTSDWQRGLRRRLHLWRAAWWREISRLRFAALEMTGGLCQTVRHQTLDGEKKRPVNICRFGAIQYGSERHRVRNREPVNIHEGAGSFRCMTSS